MQEDEKVREQNADADPAFPRCRTFYLTLLEKSRWSSSCEHVQTVLEEICTDKMVAAKGFRVSRTVPPSYDPTVCSLLAACAAIPSPRNKSEPRQAK